MARLGSPRLLGRQLVDELLQRRQLAALDQVEFLKIHFSFILYCKYIYPVPWLSLCVVPVSQSL